MGFNCGVRNSILSEPSCDFTAQMMTSVVLRMYLTHEPIRKKGNKTDNTVYWTCYQSASVNQQQCHRETESLHSQECFNSALTITSYVQACSCP